MTGPGCRCTRVLCWQAVRPVQYAVLAALPALTAPAPVELGADGAVDCVEAFVVHRVLYAGRRHTDTFVQETVARGDEFLPGSVVCTRSFCDRCGQSAAAVGCFIFEGLCVCAVCAGTRRQATKGGPL